MTRFRRSGTNWEGRRWYTPPALNSLLDEIEIWQPLPRSLDGTVASKSHDQNNPRSDHRPTPYTGTGVVRAVDAGELEPEGEVLAEAIRRTRDPRVKYCIHEGRLFSSYNHSAGPAWEWRPYSGYNDHLTHVHLSIVNNRDSDGSSWDLGLSAKETDMLLKIGDSGQAVAEVQKIMGEKFAQNNGTWAPFPGKSVFDGQAFGPGEDGEFGVTADANVKNVQGTLGQPKTGQVDQVLWDAMVYRRYGGTGGVSSATVDSKIATHAALPDGHKHKHDEGATGGALGL